MIRLLVLMVGGVPVSIDRNAKVLGDASPLDDVAVRRNEFRKKYEFPGVWVVFEAKEAA